MILYPGDELSCRASRFGNGGIHVPASVAVLMLERAKVRVINRDYRDDLCLRAAANEADSGVISRHFSG